MGRARSPKPIPPPVATAARLQRVEDLLCGGNPPTRVVETVSAEYGVTERQVFLDVAKVRDRWAREAEATRPEKRAELLVQVDDLYRRCIDGNDRKTAATALQLKADLHGLRIRPMAALVAPNAKPKDIDAWLSAALGFAAAGAAETDGGDEGDGVGSGGRGRGR